MLHFYISIIRRVLEYAVAVAVWHTGLTADLSDQLGAIQKRALRIIFGSSSFTNQSYEYFTYTLDISPLSARRNDLVMCCGSFIHFLIQPAASIILFLTKGIILKELNFENLRYTRSLLHEQINLETHLFCMHLITTVGLVLYSAVSSAREPMHN